MVSKKGQSKAGIAAKRRGQQMGDERSNNTEQQEEVKANTPALSGRRRKEANKYFADESAQQTGSDAATPRSNSPSIPGVIPTGVKHGEPGGERAFKKRGAGQGIKKG